MAEKGATGEGCWGDGVARGFLGIIATGLLVAGMTLELAAVARGLAAILGLIFAVLCAFFPAIEGSIDIRGLRVTFSGPRPARSGGKLSGPETGTPDGTRSGGSC